MVLLFCLLLGLNLSFESVRVSVVDFNVVSRMESIIPGILLRVALASLLWALGVVIYRLTLHPLAKYPGPWLAKVTGFYAVYHAYVGDVHLDMLKCHETHGKFVRYGPNKLIANSSGAITGSFSVDLSKYSRLTYWVIL